MVQVMRGSIAPQCLLEDVRAAVGRDTPDAEPQMLGPEVAWTTRRDRFEGPQNYREYTCTSKWGLTFLRALRFHLDLPQEDA